MKRTVKYFSIIIAVIVLINMLYSVFFISQNTHHDCSGETCPICEQLLTAENSIQRLAAAIVYIVAAFFMCVLAQKCMDIPKYIIAYNSPISLKVKMLN